MRHAPPTWLLAPAVVGAGCAIAVGDSAGGLGTGEAACGDVTPDDSIPVGVLWSRTAGACTAAPLGRSAILTAASCAAGDPLIFVFGGRQHLASAVIPHPDHGRAAAPGPDLAVVFLSGELADSPPLPPAGAPVLAGEVVTLAGHADPGWSPERDDDGVRRDRVAAVTDVGAWAFAHDLASDCVGGARGAPVVRAVPGGHELLGIQGTGAEVARFAEHACWIECQQAGHDSQAAGCDCAAAARRRCGDCGAEYLDTSSGDWSSCEPRPDLHPCPQGTRCDDGGQCVEDDPCAVTCTDAFGAVLCPGERGYAPCPTQPDGFRRCTCADDGRLLEACDSFCIL